MNRFCQLLFMTFIVCTSYVNAQPSFFFDPIIQYYAGENLELLNSSQPFDAYSFVQYIFDFGAIYPQHLSNTSQELLSLTAAFRMKGNFGNDGRYATTSFTPLKIGWAGTETAHNHTTDTFAFWAREVSIAYQPDSYDTPLFTLGFFPFKLGNGLILGNAYKLNEPIPGQYIYQQIDQFRPGFLCSATNNKKTISHSSKNFWFK